MADEVSLVRSDSEMRFASCFIKYLTSTVSGPVGVEGNEERRLEGVEVVGQGAMSANCVIGDQMSQSVACWEHCEIRGDRDRG